MRRVRICILMPHHWTYSMGGAEYQVKCIMDMLKTTGKYDIVYLTRNVDPKYKPNGYEIKIIKAPSSIKQRHYFVDAFMLLEDLKAINPDIIYQRVGLAYTGVGAFYARRHGRKFIWHVARDDEVTPFVFQASRLVVHRYIDKKCLEYGIRHASHIIAQTDDQAALLRQHYGRAPTIVAHNFHPLPKEKIDKSGPLKVVWVANLKPIKQPEVFLKLATDLAEVSRVQFVMIGALQGSARWNKKILQQIERTESVMYLGPLSQDSVNQMLSSAHIFVNTSKTEGFPNTFIQAWMRKVPVVSLSVNPGGVFGHSDVGFLAGSYDNLRSKVVLLIEDDTLRKKLADNAQAYAYEQHSENNVKQLMELFDLCVQET